jgi:hypothetical protein
VHCWINFKNNIISLYAFIRINGTVDNEIITSIVDSDLIEGTLFEGG